MPLEDNQRKIQEEEVSTEVDPKEFVFFPKTTLPAVSTDIHSQAFSTWPRGSGQLSLLSQDSHTAPSISPSSYSKARR